MASALVHMCSVCKQPCETTICVTPGSLYGMAVTKCCTSIHFSRMRNEVMSHAYRRQHNKNYK